MQGCRFGLGSLALLVATAGCGEEEYAILITAYGETESSLLEGTELTVTVRDLKSSLRAQSPVTELGAMEPGDPIRIGIELHSPGQFMVHMIADTDTEGGPERFVATRCYTVTGVTKSEVILVGPISSGEGGADVDGDSFTVEENCHERGIEEVGCNDQCPTIWGTDCGPDDPDINPTAVEQCDDKIDQDCDEVDAPCEDADGDTYTGCSPDAVDRSTCDCDDSDATVNPGVEETSDPTLGLCENDIDEDCSGADQCCDRDGDEVTSCCGEQIGCDCDDANADIRPGASETPGGECDGLDNNCNILIDEVGACLAPDLDADGSPASCAADPDPPADCMDDCNDCSAAMSPLGRAVCGNRIDEDCSLEGTADGRPLAEGADPCPEGDNDDDGSVGLASGGSDCDDDDPSRYPGAPDMCDDGVDFDCSGEDSSCASDGDADRWNAANECDDAVATVNPGVETDGCNGVDDDCDGIFDEDLEPRTGCVLLQGEWAKIEYDTSLLHCGECRHDCNAGCPEGTVCRSDVCIDGVCRCGIGLVPEDADPQCGGAASDFCCSDGCKDLTSDILNCGACGVVCEAPTCQFPVCNDGECGTGFDRPGTPLGGGVFCCDGQPVGECDPDNYLEDPLHTEGCGVLCGHHDRVCSPSPECTWGEYGDCLDEGECSLVNGDDRTRGCQRCGTQTSLCDTGCVWGAWQACINQGPCEVAEVGSQRCGRCGTQYRTCSDSCTWGNWGNCENEGVCTPGEVDDDPCGDCGIRYRTCQDDCQWGAWGDCGGEGVCGPGDVDSDPCGNCGGGSMSRTCQDNCTWGGWGACGGGTCGAATESRNCGTGGSGNDGCGRQSRSCSATCQWSSYGACAADAGRTAECNDSNACTTDTCEADGDCAYASCGGATPACCGAAVGCRACCGSDASTCTGNPGTCKDWSCSGNACVAVNEPQNGNDPETECAPAGGFAMICCDGACAQCCNGDSSDCGTDPLCQDWTCNAGDNCVAVDETDGTDPEVECPPANGFPMVCCDAACVECCNGDATDCGTEPVCQNYTCNGSDRCISSDEPDGSQPAACGTDICCDGYCEECCNGSATNCDDPGVCLYATCDANDTCQPDDEANGSNPGGECGSDECCDGSCTACCNGDAGNCADPGVCQHAVCDGNDACQPENDANGSDQGDQCGSDICCDGSCEECCNGSTSNCGGGDPNPPGNCLVWVCDASDTCVTDFATAATDPFGECNSPPSRCCDGAGGCQDGSC